MHRRRRLERTAEDVLEDSMGAHELRGRRLHDDRCNLDTHSAHHTRTAIAARCAAALPMLGRSRV